MPDLSRIKALISGLGLVQAKAAEHANRDVPLKNYGAGLLVPGERKSVEPTALVWHPIMCDGCTNRGIIWWPIRGATKRFWRAAAQRPELA